MELLLIPRIQWLLQAQIVFSLVYADKYEQTIYRIPGVGPTG